MLSSTVLADNTIKLSLQVSDGLSCINSYGIIIKMIKDFFTFFHILLIFAIKGISTNADGDSTFRRVVSDTRDGPSFTLF